MRSPMWLLAAVGCRWHFDPRQALSDASAGPDAWPAPAASCATLADSCGRSATDSCCATLIVPGGSFYRGYDAAGDGMYRDGSSPATVTTFWLDKYEVTVGRFRQFLAANQGSQQTPPPAGAGARTLGGTPNQGGWESAWNG